MNLSARDPETDVAEGVREAEGLRDSGDPQRRLLAELGHPAKSEAQASRFVAAAAKPQQKDVVSRRRAWLTVPPERMDCLTMIS